jgi:hypothetical protein
VLDGVIIRNPVGFADLTPITRLMTGNGSMNISIGQHVLSIGGDNYLTQRDASINGCRCQPYRGGGIIVHDGATCTCINVSISFRATCIVRQREEALWSQDVEYELIASRFN